MTLANFGTYQGQVSTAFADQDLLHRLADPLQLLENATLITDGADRVYRVELQHQGYTLAIALKAFKPSGRLKTWCQRHKGSQARRSWVAAESLTQQAVSTPHPIAYLEKYQSGQLLESYYLSVFSAGMVSFREVMSDILWQPLDHDRLLALLKAVAPVVRALHDAGWRHGDLGNQNILLRQHPAGSFQDVQLIDLDRARYMPQGLSWSARGHDLARLIMPPDYLQIFKQLYCDGPVPLAFDQAEQRSRARYRRHARTYRYRHPIRAYRHAQACRRDPHHRLDYPDDIVNP